MKYLQLPRELGWIDSLPQRFRVVRLGTVVTQVKQKNFGNVNENLLSLSYGKIISKDIVSTDGLLPESFETYNIIEPGDIVFRLTDLQNDKRSLRTGLSTQKGIITSAYVSVRPVGIDPRYLAYFMRAMDLAKVFYSLGGGLRQSLNYAEAKLLPVVLPPKDEQQAIADFLDREIAEIDNVLVEHKHLRDLLFERRTEVITTATHSSNPEIKEAPLVRLRHVTRLNPSPRMDISSNPNQVFPLYNMDSISEFGSLRPPVLRPYSELANGYSYLEPTDVAYAKVTPCFENGKGLVGTELDGPSFATTELTVLRPAPELDQNYLALVLQSADFHAVGEASMTGAGGLKRVSETAARNYRFPLPDKKTQTRIVEQVRFEVDSTDSLISDSNRLSGLLIERRAALISAAVTGQIDVTTQRVSITDQVQDELEAHV